MSKALKTIGMIAGAVALVATGVGAVAGGAIVGTAVGAAGPVAVTLGSVTASVATFAGLAAGVASVGAQLTYSNKPPPARGSVSQILVSPDAPQPYVMGEGYFAGVLRHDAAYGATLKKVPNPYRFMVTVYSGGGPIEEITPWVDQAAVSSWYTDYLWTTTQLGACPEASALAPHFAGAPGWDADSKLSGQAAIAWSLKFDKEGKVYSSGTPQLGGYGKWVKCYDPRLDSTRPGGSGSHRADDETTWAWSERPALHAGTYALGRHQNGKRTFGVGMPDVAIDWSAIAAWANVCDANDWKIFGPIYEPMPETRWPNLKEICAAGAGRPIFAGGKLTFHYSAPCVALDTFTSADLAEGPGSVTATKSRFGRPNTIVPKVRSPEHRWELVAAETPVTSSVYVDEDGGERKVEWPFNLVKDFDQGAQLAAYVLADSRELQPITLSCGVRVRDYQPGDCVHLNIAPLELDTDAVIVAKEYDHATMVTTFTLIGETPEKHDWALGRTVDAPPTPVIGQTGEERDRVSDAAGRPYGWQLAIIRTASVKNPRNTSNVARALLIGSDAGVTATISVARHDWDYPDGTADVTRELATITGLAFDTAYYVYFDDPDLDDTAPTYHATTDRAEAINSSDHPDRHPLGEIITPADGGADTEGGRLPGDGYGTDSPQWLLDLLEDFNSANNLNYDPIDAPTFSVGLSHSSNDNGSVNILASWVPLSSGDQATVDGIEWELHQKSTNAAVTAGTGSPSRGGFPDPSRSSLTFDPQQPTSWYTPFFRYYRVVEPDPVKAPNGRIYSAWASPANAPYRPSTTTAIGGGGTVTVGGVSASTLASAATNFNAENDKNGLTPSAATSVTLSSVLFTNGSANDILSFSHTSSSTPGDANNIDGYLPWMMIRPSSSGYTYNPSDKALLVWGTPIPADPSVTSYSARFVGVNQSAYRTGGVIPYRRVSSTVAVDEIIYGPVAQTSTSTPHQSNGSPVWQGKLNTTDVALIEDWATRAGVTIKPDGTLEDDTVGAAAILDAAINATDWVYQGSDIGLGESDTFYDEFLTITARGKNVRVMGLFDYQINITDPALNEAAYALIYLRALRLSTGIYDFSTEATIGEVWQLATATGTKFFSRKTLAMYWDFDGLHAGESYDIGYYVTTGSNCGLVLRALRYLRAEDKGADE